MIVTAVAIGLDRVPSFCVKLEQKGQALISFEADWLLPVTAVCIQTHRWLTLRITSAEEQNQWQIGGLMGGPGNHTIAFESLLRMYEIRRSRPADETVGLCHRLAGN
jgi:hypothetical protein